MTYENKAMHTPLSWNAAKKGYIEKAFWLGQFKPGSSFTITEDLPRGKNMRFFSKPNPKGGKSFELNLIKINDGFVEKDLELNDIEAGILFATVPDSVTNIKGCCFVNESGRWRNITQVDEESRSNFPPKSAEIAKSMEPAEQKAEIPKQLSDYAAMLGNAVKSNNTYGVPTNIQVLTKMADTIYPNRALDVIQAAKAAGLIYEQNNEYKAV